MHATIPTYGNTGIRIRPQNITQKACIRHITWTSNIRNLFHLTEFGRETTVHANNLIINDRTAGQTVEGVAKLLPHLDRETTTAFVVKAVNAINAGALVIPPQEEKVLGVLDFVGKEQADNFQGLFPAIHIVTKKQVVGLVMMCERWRQRLLVGLS